MKRKIGMYGEKTRKLQRSLTRETFALTFKCANVYRYLGSSESTEPSINDVQSTVFYEVPDRAYDSNAVPINIGFEQMSESQMDFSRFGMINPLGNEQTVRVHLDDMACLGRWLIVGDVLEIPFFERDGQKSYWEINDVDDKPSYEKFYVTLSIAPLGDTRETREIEIDRSGFDISEQVRQHQSVEFEEQLPYEGLVMPDEPDPDPETMEPVSNRRPKQGSFLDDPTKTF